MFCLMSAGAQPLCYAYVDTGVDEKAHELGRVNFFLGEPSRVFECLSHIFRSQLGISLQHVLDPRPMRDLGDDDGDGDSKSADAGAASHDFRVECDVVEQAVGAIHEARTANRD